VYTQHVIIVFVSYEAVPAVERSARARESASRTFTLCETGLEEPCPAFDSDPKHQGWLCEMLLLLLVVHAVPRP